MDQLAKQIFLRRKDTGGQSIFLKCSTSLGIKKMEIKLLQDLSHPRQNRHH